MRVGDRIGFAGPRVHWQSNGGADWTLLVADETGLPALAAIAEELPRGHRAIALVEVADAAERLTLHVRARLELRWLHRDGAPAGTSPLLPEAVAALDLPPGRGRAWGGGEALAMRDVRRHLRGEREMPAGDAPSSATGSTTRRPTGSERAQRVVPGSGQDEASVQSLFATRYGKRSSSSISSPSSAMIVPGGSGSSATPLSCVPSS